MNRWLRGSGDVRVVGHRGAPRAARENTLDGFARAAALGATMVELDVRLTRDGVMVVHHDPVIAGLGAIVAHDAVALPAHVPTLVAALDTCAAAGLLVNIEIKNDPDEPDFDPRRSLADAVVAEVARRPDAVGTGYLVSSFDEATVERVHGLDAALATAFLFMMPRRTVAATVRRAADAGFDALHPWWRGCSRSLIEAAHEAGLAVNTWTVNDPERMRALARRGVDAIVTDVPDVACAACVAVAGRDR